MKPVRVGLLLTVTILVMAVAPLITAFYLLEDALRTSLNLGFNPQIVRMLDTSAEICASLPISTNRERRATGRSSTRSRRCARSTPSQSW